MRSALPILLYAGRAGTGMPVKELERVWQRLQLIG
jgi:hypothetical protein